MEQEVTALRVRYCVMFSDMSREKVVPRKIIVPAWFVWSIQHRGDEFWVEVDNIDLEPLPKQTPSWLPPEDFLEDFYASSRRTRETSRDLPHIRFSEARTRDELVEFVMEFGPVLGQFQEEVPATGKRLFIQNVSVLAAQQALFAALQRLVWLLNELDHISRLTAVGKFPIRNRADIRTALVKEERKMLAEISLKRQEVVNAMQFAVNESERAGISDSLKTVVTNLQDLNPDADEVDNLSTSHRTLCQVFNLFPPRLYYSRGVVQECPASQENGIRPVLYFLLREVYAMKHRIKLCKRHDCGIFFIPDRGNGEYCSIECGTKVRQRLSNERKRLVRLVQI